MNPLQELITLIRWRKKNRRRNLFCKTETRNCNTKWKITMWHKDVQKNHSCWKCYNYVTINCRCWKKKSISTLNSLLIYGMPLNSDFKETQLFIIISMWRFEDIVLTSIFIIHLLILIVLMCFVESKTGLYILLNNYRPSRITRLEKNNCFSERKAVK